MNSYIVQFIVFTIPFSVIYGAITQNSILSIIITGIIFGLSMSFVFNLFSQYNPLKTANFNESELIHKGGASHKRFIETVGGFLYLTKTQLLFVPHRFNIQVKPLSIALSNIQNVSTGKSLGLVPNLLIVETNENKTEKFLVFEHEKWVEIIKSEIN